MERQINYHNIFRDGTPLVDKNFSVTSSGSYNINRADTTITIVNSGTITITGSGTLRILVVGGGAGGLGGSQTTNGNRGGGAGGVLEDYYNVTPGIYTITIGNGGNVGSGGGGSRVVGITPLVNGGNSTGTSGNGFTFGSEVAVDIDGSETAWDTAYFSGGGGGSAGVGSNENGYVGAEGGSGFYSTIRGGEVFGSGGSGGVRSSTKTYTPPIANGAGFIEYDATNPIIRNASGASFYGNGGNGGGKSTTKTAAASAGFKGVVIIRYTRV